MNRTHASLPLLHGVVPPLVTPLSASGSLDAESLGRLICHVIDGGVHGIFVLGTTAEWCSLPRAVRHEVIELSCGEARRQRRVPVLAHVTSPALEESLADAHRAADAGAAAVVVSAPYYFPLTQAELVRYVKTLVDDQPLPVVLYNIPQMTRTAYEVQTVARLMQHPRVIGIKDSSGDVDYHRRLIALARQRPEFGVLVGTEMLLAPMVMAGSHGCVGGGGNLCPRLLVEIYDAARAGDASRLVPLQAKLAALGELFRMDGAAACISALKVALRMKGVLKHEAMAAPYLGLSAAQQETVAQVLREMDRLRAPSAAAPPAPAPTAALSH